MNGLLFYTHCVRNVPLVYVCFVKLSNNNITTLGRGVIVYYIRWRMESLDITITARSSATGLSWMVMRKALWRRTFLKSVSSSTTYPQFTTTVLSFSQTMNA